MRLGEEDQVGEVGDGAGRATISRLSSDEALRSLGTASPGLSTAEAHRRLRTYGPNRIEKARGDSRLVSFLRQFGHFFALILWVAAGLAFFAEWSEPGQGMAKVGVAIVVVVVVSGVFSFWQEYRAEQTLAGLRGSCRNGPTCCATGRPSSCRSSSWSPGTSCSSRKATTSRRTAG